jgi:hypothetical protein
MSKRLRVLFARGTPAAARAAVPNGSVPPGEDSLPGLPFDTFQDGPEV